jgi:subtilisin family serine protease
MRARLSIAAITAATLSWAIVAVPGVAASNDPDFGDQWNLTQIGASGAWAHSTGAGVTIGIVDTGVDSDHPDLAGKVEAQANCIGGACRDVPATDGEGHGTAVAGIAAATAGNGVGIAGVAPDARLIVAKALDDRGAGDTEDINNAIRWVVDHGARVVNLSLGDASVVVTARLGSSLASAIEYAWSKGAIPVLAAGNYAVGLSDGSSANYGNLDAVVVGATDKAGAVSWFSTPLGDAKWGIVAPGGDDKGKGADILSPIPGGKYDWLAGTSMATPHVSGALALLLATGLTPSAAVERLLATADHATACGDGCRGRLRIDAALAPLAPARPEPAAHRRAAPGHGVPIVPAVLAGALVCAAALAGSRRWQESHLHTG